MKKIILVALVSLSFASSNFCAEIALKEKAERYKEVLGFLAANLKNFSAICPPQFFPADARDEKGLIRGCKEVSEMILDELEEQHAKPVVSTKLPNGTIYRYGDFKFYTEIKRLSLQLPCK